MNMTFCGGMFYQQNGALGSGYISICFMQQFLIIKRHFKLAHLVNLIELDIKVKK